MTASYHRGDIVLVVYRPPTSGPHRITKSRPMVVMSSHVFHSERGQDVIAALITTKVKKYRGQTDYALVDWQAAGLSQPSTVRSTLATVERNQVAGKVGALTPADLRGVEAILRRALRL